MIMSTWLLPDRERRLRHCRAVGSLNGWADVQQAMRGIGLTLGEVLEEEGGEGMMGGSMLRARFSIIGRAIS